jgi:GntR family transcriptional repressor for pyruvate dehydrogenase complex
LPSEKELLSSLQISRSTLREAISVLQDTGQIRVMRGRIGGAVVLPRDDPPSRDTLQELAASRQDILLDALNFRAIVEPGAAELAATYAPEEDLSRLYELSDQLRSVDAGRYRAHHSQFHLEIAALSRSPLLTRAVTDVVVELHDFIAVPMLNSSLSHSDRRHRAILDAIAKGDSRLARIRMLRNVKAAEGHIRDLILNTGGSIGTSR